MKFNRRDLLKRLASIPLVGMLVKKKPLLIQGTWIPLGEPVPGIAVFRLEGLPLPIVHSDFIMALRRHAVLRGMSTSYPLKEHEDLVKAERSKIDVSILASRRVEVSSWLRIRWVPVIERRDLKVYLVRLFLP